MAFSIRFGLLCMCSIMLLFLPAQGRFQRTTNESQDVGYKPVCCTNTSKARINSAAISCFRQRKITHPDCPIDAYILETDQHKQYCVDPTAEWLPQRLERLRKKGIYCTEF
ncbi:C-C motif chemokine 8-like [Scomber japonicus]|uniref:C-C motif chemokine 8-like n=1 Tax=Scomber japonicus TaxID=13676 RepID=UPI002304EA9F|nr:C-C motif chemokine 8-like [Scomber japonicus]